MMPNSHAPWFALLLAVCGGSFLPVYAQPAKKVLASTKRIKGIATTPGGKPLAGTTLYLLALPGSQMHPDIGQSSKVVTDAQGRFTWVVPEKVAWNINTDVSSLNETPIDCYALAQSTSWTATPRLARDRNSKGDIHDLMQKATVPCKTRWLAVGENAPLSVVVPDRGSVDLLVRGPNGRPLARRKVEIVVPDRFSNHAGAVVYQGQTDAAGHLRWQGFPGLRRLLLSAPGVGFGSTGTFEVLPNKVATPQSPPLAAFARVSGTVSPSLFKPGATVRADVSGFSGSEEHKWLPSQGKVDARNRFTIEDLLPGEYLLGLFDGAQKAKRVRVQLVPGEFKSGLRIEPLPAEAAGAKRPQPVVLLGEDPSIKHSVAGKVTDTAGNPVVGADVYAICSYHGAIRQYQEVHTAKSGADGNYLIAGLPGTRVSLVAARPNSPLAFASPQSGEPSRTSLPRAENLRANLVFSLDHPRLLVRVLAGNKPVARASVRLSPQSGSGLFSPFYVGSARGPASEALAKLLQPTSATRADGTVEFSDLTPGLWSVTVTSGDKAALDYIGRWSGGSPQKNAFNVVSNVAVQAGAPRQVTVGIYPQPGSVSVQLLTPNGKPPASPNVALSYGLAGFSPSASSTSFTVDKKGTGSYSFERSGLWNIRTSFRDTPIESFPASAEPFYAGEAVVAISPAFPRTRPIVIHSNRRDRGRIHVRIEDERGQRATGSVWIGDSWDAARYAASVAAGEGATFSEMPSGTYSLRAAIKPAPLPELGTASATFPSDEALSDVKRFVPQNAVVRSGEETTVVFRPQPQCYIRGTLVAPDGPANYSVYYPYHLDVAPTVGYDKTTGEFVAGPFAPGKTTLHVQRTNLPAGEARDQGEDFSVEVVAGKVVHTTLTVGTTRPPAVSHATDTLLTMGGVFNSNRASSLAATILLPDGKTPAWGAIAAVVVPQTWQPVQMARTDATGQLNAVEHWYTGSSPENPPPGSPSEPVVVVWLPGSHGAVIVPSTAKIDAPLVLPQSVSVKGRITVSGQSIAGLASSFVVFAAYEGKGKLNSLLSIEATVEPDGTFELPGLTPGTYEVQAARDGIWLSTSQHIVVDSKPLPPLTFDIASIGAPTTVHLVDAAGKPRANQLIELKRPPGPLSRQLWPRSLTTDATGNLRLEGFEAGTHQFQLVAQNATNPAVSPTSTKTIPFSTTIKPFVTGGAGETQTITVP